MDEKLAVLWRRFQPAILARVEVVEAAADALRNGTLSVELQKSAEECAHKLAGSLGTFGFPRGTEVSSELEHLFQLENPPEARVAELAAELGDIRQIP
jgi:HPt (histidine-containing phosphotransfer) domain-containing protein